MPSDPQQPPRPSSEESRKAAGWNFIDFSHLAKPPAAFVFTVYAIVSILAVSVLAVGLWTLGVFLLQSATPASSFEETSKRLVAIGVLIAAPFAIWRIILSHWQASIAAKQAELARDELHTSLFAKAVELLGATRDVIDESGKTITGPSTEVRLGAIYALERIAYDSERDHWPIMETLCAYVRENAGPPQPPSTSLRETLAVVEVTGEVLRAREHRPSVDVQAALTVIGRRRPERLAYEARLRKEAINKRAYSLDLSQSNLNGVVLDGLNFDLALFDRSSLVLASAYRSMMQGATFRSVDADGAEFSRADLRGAELSGAWFPGGRFIEAQLSSCSCAFTIFDCADFERTDMTGATLMSCKMRGASLLQTTLIQSSFKYADLRAAYLSGVDLDSVDFEGANLAKTLMRCVFCAGAKNLRRDMLESAIGDETTSIDSEETRPSSWPQTPDDFERRQKERYDERRQIILKDDLYRPPT